VRGFARKYPCAVFPISDRRKDRGNRRKSKFGAFAGLRIDFRDRIEKEIKVPLS